MKRNKDIPLLSVAIIVAASSAGIGFMLGQRFPSIPKPPTIPTRSGSECVERPARDEEPDSGSAGWTPYDSAEWGIRFEYPEVCEIGFMPMVDGLYLSAPQGVSERNCPFLGILFYPETGPSSRRVFPDGLAEASRTLRDPEERTVGRARAVSGIFRNENTGKESRNTYVEHDGHIYLLYHGLETEAVSGHILERMIGSVGFMSAE